MKVEAGRLSPTSINKTLTRLAQILEAAVEYGLLERNPARGRARRVKAVAPRRVHLDRADQIESLLGAAGKLDQVGRGPEHRRPLLATLVFASPRLGEALALRWRDVDLASGTIQVGRSKTDAGVRQIDMLPALRDELAAYKSRAQRTSPDDLVFATGQGKALSQSNVRNRVLAGAVAEANARRLDEGLSELPEGLTPHSLRRTFISALLALGEEVPFVMQQVGHADPKVTLGIYARVMFRKDGERERLRRLLGEPAGAAGQTSTGAVA
jgi:integrase